MDDALSRIGVWIGLLVLVNIFTVPALGIIVY